MKPNRAKVSFASVETKKEKRGAVVADLDNLTIGVIGQFELPSLMSQDDDGSVQKENNSSTINDTILDESRSKTRCEKSGTNSSNHQSPRTQGKEKIVAQSVDLLIGANSRNSKNVNTSSSGIEGTQSLVTLPDLRSRRDHFTLESYLQSKSNKNLSKSRSNTLHHRTDESSRENKKGGMEDPYSESTASISATALLPIARKSRNHAHPGSLLDTRNGSLQINLNRNAQMNPYISLVRQSGSREHEDERSARRNLSFERQIKRFSGSELRLASKEAITPMLMDQAEQNSPSYNNNLSLLVKNRANLRQSSCQTIDALASGEQPTADRRSSMFLSKLRQQSTASIAAYQSSKAILTAKTKATARQLISQTPSLPSLATMKNHVKTVHFAENGHGVKDRPKTLRKDQKKLSAGVSMKGTEQAPEKVEDQEFASYSIPKDMYVSSRLVFTEQTIKASEEFLAKANVFHHLWQRDEEVADIKRAIKIHRAAVDKKQAAKDKLKVQIRKYYNKQQVVAQKSAHDPAQHTDFATTEGARINATKHDDCQQTLNNAPLTTSTYAHSATKVMEEVLDLYTVLKSVKKQGNELLTAKSKEKMTTKKEHDLAVPGRTSTPETQHSLLMQLQNAKSGQPVEPKTREEFEALLRLRHELSEEVPAYLIELADSGVDLSQINEAFKVEEEDVIDAKGSHSCRRKAGAHIKSKIKHLQLKAVKVQDPHALLEKKLLEQKNEQLQNSVKTLRALIVSTQHGDPDLKKQQMFGGDKNKEKQFYDNLALMKERFLRTMYNITKQKESLLFSNKMNKLVTLVRKATKESVIDELVQSIDDELLKKMRQVKQKLDFVSLQSDSEVTQQLNKLYGEFEQQYSIESRQRKITLLQKNLQLKQLGLKNDFMDKIQAIDSSKLIFKSNKKLLDKLINIEKNLTSLDQEKKRKHLIENSNFQRKCCQNKGEHEQKHVEMAKHYIYHRPNPNLKYSIQSKHLEEQKRAERHSTIVQRVSPHKAHAAGAPSSYDGGSMQSDDRVTLLALERSLIELQEHMTGIEKEIVEEKQQSVEQEQLKQKTLQKLKASNQLSQQSSKPKKNSKTNVTNVGQESMFSADECQKSQDASRLRTGNANQDAASTEPQQAAAVQGKHKHSSLEPTKLSNSKSPDMRPPKLTLSRNTKQQSASLDPLPRHSGGSHNTPNLVKNRTAEKRTNGKARIGRRSQFQTAAAIKTDSQYTSSASSLSDEIMTTEEGVRRERADIDNTGVAKAGEQAKFPKGTTVAQVEVNEEEDLLNEKADHEFLRIEEEILDLLFSFGLDSEFQLIADEEEEEEDLIAENQFDTTLLQRAQTNIMFSKLGKSEEILSLDMLKAAKDRAVRRHQQTRMQKEKDEKKREILKSKYTGSQIYEDKRHVSRFEDQTPSKSSSDGRKLVAPLPHQGQLQDLVETCNQLMLTPTIVDQQAIDEEDRVITKKIQAIDKLQDEINLQYDYRAKVELQDIERIQRNNQANDDVNLKPNFKLDYMTNVKRDWLVKSRKNAQKEFVSNLTKHDYLRLINQIDKSLELSDSIKMLKKK